MNAHFHVSLFQVKSLGKRLRRHQILPKAARPDSLMRFERKLSVRRRTADLFSVKGHEAVKLFDSSRPISWNDSVQKRFFVHVSSIYPGFNTCFNHDRMSEQRFRASNSRPASNINQSWTKMCQSKQIVLFVTTIIVCNDM